MNNVLTFRLIYYFFGKKFTILFHYYTGMRN